MSSYTIEKATVDDNEELCALCNIPLQGNIMLALERSPDFFSGSKIQCEEIETYACRSKAHYKIMGVFSVGKRRVFYGTEIKFVRYFSDLRIHPEAQGSRLLYQIGRFIADSTILNDCMAQSIVFAENKVMLKLIEQLPKLSKKWPLFNFYPAGNYTSYMVKFSKEKPEKNTGYLVKKAEIGYIPLMQKFLLAEGSKKVFYPYYDFNLPGSTYYEGLAIDQYYLAFDNEKLVGMAGIWDQHTIKQTRIYGYSVVYNLLRPFINIYGFISNGFQLPATGTILQYLTIHSLLIRNNDSEICSLILQKINTDFYKLQYNYFLIGFDEKDNLNTSLLHFKNKRIIRGKHFLISKGERPEGGESDSVYYLEAARI